MKLVTQDFTISVGSVHHPEVGLGRLPIGLSRKQDRNKGRIKKRKVPTG